ncbi:RDD family protein [Paenarthrobacter sp. Z7-10]|uniref:RDD family protein n=1 Tax=Paenarthrobacter sp. Z7-10 TaxID=2787635 RepID=UPI0022A9C815|nr:RDD family protein [Paenarthrobacter sp. Z7-10]MCZ2403257.1 RDD family protein [Paenarthrobacter sp. Z7-10]
MSSIITGEAVILELRPASFAGRALGAGIDVVVQILLALAFFIVLGAVPDVLDPAAAKVLILTSVLSIFVALPIAVETLSRGKSLGKLVMGLRVVRDDGGAIRFRHALIRGLLGFFELYLTFGSVAFLVSLFNERSKRLGDMLAGTYSLRERVVPAAGLILNTPAYLQPWAQLADIGRLPDPLARRISVFLRQASRMSPASRIQLAASLATEASAFVSPPPPPGTLPDAFLAALTAERRDRDLRRFSASRDRSDRLARRLYRLPFSQDEQPDRD